MKVFSFSFDQTSASVRKTEPEGLPDVPWPASDKSLKPKELTTQPPPPKGTPGPSASLAGSGQPAIPQGTPGPSVSLAGSGQPVTPEGTPGPSANLAGSGQETRGGDRAEGMERKVAGFKPVTQEAKQEDTDKPSTSTGKASRLFTISL